MPEDLISQTCLTKLCEIGGKLDQSDLSNEALEDSISQICLIKLYGIGGKTGCLLEKGMPNVVCLARVVEENKYRNNEPNCSDPNNLRKTSSSQAESSRDDATGISYA